MASIMKNILALVVGIVVGSLVNIGLVNLGPVLIPLPEGADISTMEGLRDSMKLFSPVNFVFPFLGHAAGAFVGSFIAAKIAFSHRMKVAIGISAFFLIGGLSMVKMVGGPMWFIVVDLALAYIPMGYLGGNLGGAKGGINTKHGQGDCL